MNSGLGIDHRVFCYYRRQCRSTQNLPKVKGFPKSIDNVMWFKQIKENANSLAWCSFFIVEVVGKHVLGYFYFMSCELNYDIGASVARADNRSLYHYTGCVYERPVLDPIFVFKANYCFKGKKTVVVITNVLRGERTRRRAIGVRGARCVAPPPRAPRPTTREIGTRYIDILIVYYIRRSSHISQS